MALSFQSKVSLDVAIAVFSALGIFCPYLSIPAGVVVLVLALVLVYNEITTRSSERADFRKNIIHELWILGGRLINTGVGDNRQIPYSEWSGNASFQKAALGNDYALWKSFYDSMGTRNDFFAAHAGYQPFHYEDSRKLKLFCLVKFIELSGTTMIQQSDHKKQFEEIIVKARRQRDTMSASENPDSLSV